MFEIAVEQGFASAHALRNYKGRCENVHGHNWKVRVVIEGEKLDATGMLSGLPGCQEPDGRDASTASTIGVSERDSAV